MFERLSWLGRLALSIELVRGIAGSAAAAAASELMLASLSFSKLVRGAKPPAKPRVWCHGGPCGGTAVSPATPCGDPAVSIMSGVERLRSLSRLARLLELLVPCRLSSVGPKSAARLLVEPPCPSTASARACSRASTSAALGVSSAPVLWLDWLPPLRCRGTPVMLLLKLLLPLPPAASTSAVSTTPPGTMKGRDILPCVLGCGGPRRCATATLRRQAGRLAGWRAGWLAGGRVAHSVRARSHTARATRRRVRLSHAAATSSDRERCWPCDAPAALPTASAPCELRRPARAGAPGRRPPPGTSRHQQPAARASAPLPRGGLLPRRAGGAARAATALFAYVAIGRLGKKSQEATGATRDATPLERRPRRSAGGTWQALAAPWCLLARMHVHEATVPQEQPRQASHRSAPSRVCGTRLCKR